MDSDWAQLPEALLFDIAMRLECVQDLVMFSAVCSSWRDVSAKVKPIWAPTRAIMPWLILAENTENNPLCIRSVFDPNRNKLFQMELPETFGRHCWGCEDGWIFTLGLDMEIHLFNPLTRSRLTLPPAMTLPSVDYRRDKELIRRNFIQRVTLLTIPPNDEIIVMVVYHENQLAFAKPGDSVWTGVQDDAPEPRLVQDVVSYGGMILTVYQDGTLAVYDTDFFLLPRQDSCKPLVILPKHERDFLDLYLVESYGNLLAVLRYISFFDEEDNYIEDQNISYQTLFFEVVMFDFNSRAWWEINDLGEEALFVGNNSAMSVWSSKSVNCRPNCIYFTDEKPHYDLERFVGHDMGVYSLQDRRLERFYDGDDILSKFCPPFWFMPKFV